MACLHVKDLCFNKVCKPISDDTKYKAPDRAHYDDVGVNLYGCYEGEEDFVLIAPDTIRRIPTGYSIVTPRGHYAQIQSRSSLAIRGLAVLGGVIDYGFTGELIVILANVGQEVQRVDLKKAIAQVVLIKTIIPKIYVDEVESTPVVEKPRGSARFGSTDNNKRYGHHYVSFVISSSAFVG